MSYARRKKKVQKNFNSRYNHNGIPLKTPKEWQYYTMTSEEKEKTIKCLVCHTIKCQQYALFLILNFGALLAATRLHGCVSPPEIFLQFTASTGSLYNLIKFRIVWISSNIVTNWLRILVADELLPSLLTKFSMAPLGLRPYIHYCCLFSTCLNVFK